MSQSGSAVELRGLSRRFGRRWALRSVSLTIERGEVLGVLGHNGSGKSTLLRVLSTSLRPSAGDGWVFGQHLKQNAPQVRELIGFLAHAPGLYDELTARENLRFAVAMRGGTEDDIDPVLDKVGLLSVRDERVRGFSAGMQRRLSLARVLLGQPRLLLLDEPYNNFDPAGIALVNDVILETQRSGGSALIVLHDQRQGESVLDRTIELARGALIRERRTAAGVEPREAAVSAAAAATR